MKKLAKISAVLVSAMLAVSAFGCGSSDEAPKAADPGFDVQAIQVNDAGYTITDEGNLRYAFVAVNPNDGHIAKDVTFTVEAYDANGSMIAGDSESISALYPGAETPGAGETELFSQTTETPEVSNLTIVAMMDSITWASTTVTNDDIEDSVNIVNPRMSEDEAGSLAIKASIQLAEGDDMKLDVSQSSEFRAIAVLFDAAGNAICGTDPVTFTPGSNDGSYDFSQLITNPPAYAECNLYVTPLS